MVVKNSIQCSLKEAKTIVIIKSNFVSAIGTSAFTIEFMHTENGLADHVCTFWKLDIFLQKFMSTISNHIIDISGAKLYINFCQSAHIL